MNPKEVDGWVDAAFEADAKEFSALLSEAKEVLKEEQRLREGSGLVRIALHAVRSIVVVGDIHGDLDSLVHLLKEQEVANADRIIFLGDYGDRGEESVEVYYLILRLILSADRRDKILLLRGNHEGPPDMPFMPHELPLFFARKYGDQGMELYEKIRDLWEFLPYAVLVETSYLMVHGGLPAGVTSIGDIAYAHETHPSSSTFKELLWSDPVEGTGYFYSMRGAGMKFGEDITAKVLRAVSVKTLIRSHEPCEGVEVRQNGKILTLFSRKGAPYYNTKAAYLFLDESMLREAKDANELVRAAVRVW